MARGVSIEPLGSRMMGARVLPEMFGGLVAIGLGVPMVTPLTTGRAPGSAKFIGPSENASVLGRANAIASAIVVSFTAFPYHRLDKGQHGNVSLIAQLNSS
jgi:hypothetical protein